MVAYNIWDVEEEFESHIFYKIFLNIRMFLIFCFESIVVKKKRKSLNN